MKTEWRGRAAASGIVVALAVLAVGCSGSKKSSATDATPSATGTAAGASSGSSAAAAQYLTAADALDAGYVRWRAGVLGKTRVAEIEALAATYAADLTAFDSAIARVSATGKTATDISTLVSDDTVVVADLGSITRQTQATLAGWSAKLTADGVPARAAANAVRTDFGLPPTAP